MLGHRPCDALRLVEPPLPPTFPRQRHRNDGGVPSELTRSDPQLRGEGPQHLSDPLPPPKLQRVHREAHVILVNQTGARPAKRTPTHAARPTKPRCYKMAVRKPATWTKRLHDTRQLVQATKANGPPKRKIQKRGAEQALPRKQNRPDAVSRRTQTPPSIHEVVRRDLKMKPSRRGRDWISIRLPVASHQLPAAISHQSDDTTLKADSGR